MKKSELKASVLEQFYMNAFYWLKDTVGTFILFVIILWLCLKTDFLLIATSSNLKFSKHPTVVIQSHETSSIINGEILMNFETI